MESDRILSINYMSDDAVCDDCELDDSGYCGRDTSHYEGVLMRIANPILRDLGWLAT